MEETENNFENQNFFSANLDFVGISNKSSEMRHFVARNMFQVCSTQLELNVKRSIVQFSKLKKGAIGLQLI